MTKYPQAQGQIVKMGNVGTEKSFRCWVDFPAETAERMIAEFGWASNVKPIPVVMAGLTRDNGNPPDAEEITSTPPSREAGPQTQDPHIAVPASRSFSLTQRIGALCTKPVFHQFLADVHADRWRFLNKGTDTEKAAEIVRSLCDVKSRADIETNPDALNRWRAIASVFVQWQSAPRPD